MTDTPNQDDSGTPDVMADDSVAAGGATVTPITKGKKKQAAPRKEELVDLYVDALFGRPYTEPKGKKWPEFRASFHCLEDRTGHREVVEELPGEVMRHVDVDVLSMKLLAYSRRTPRGFELSTTSARETALTWLAQVEPLDEATVAPVRPLSEPGKCWRRLPWDYTAGPTPTFDEIMGRMSNAEAFKAWVGSLFVVGSDRQQYVWLWGSGQNGKSSLARFLNDVFKTTYRSEFVSASQTPNQFWTSGLLGSRLVVFPDCNHYRFPTDGLFKSLTGDDGVRIEFKGRPIYTTSLNCLFMFLSNEKPDLTGEKADLRRAIYCELLPLASGTEVASTNEYQARLWAEGASWILNCIETWKRLTGTGSRDIPTDREALLNIIASGQEEFNHVFDVNFQRVSIDDTRPLKEQPYVKAHDMQELYARLAKDYGNAWLNVAKQRAWKKWLEGHQRVVATVVRLDGTNTERRYVGMTWRHNKAPPTGDTF